MTILEIIMSIVFGILLSVLLYVAGFLSCGMIQAMMASRDRVFNWKTWEWEDIK